MTVVRILLAACVCAAAASAQAPKPAARPAQKATKPKPPAKPATEAAATPASAIKAAKGFKVDLVYSVPKADQGSWVNLCVDPKGRIVASDQYGALYRVTLDPAGPAKVEKLAVDIGMAQGLLYAFDALYVMVNAGGKDKSGADKAGLYRVTDTDGDDMPDKVEFLRSLQGGGGEHGPHAILKHPDGKRLTVVCGNQTKLPQVDTSLVPRNWGEDHLLPRVPDGNGFMKGVLAPGGFVANVDPDGKNWELQSVGFRNQYDAAYDRSGELFTFDADMEWDQNTPWYRPTRVCHVVPGAEFGWRNGAGKYRDYYIDNLPAVVNIGPGSPTGVCFGYGAKFPAKYQDAFFISDWSYGKLYAVHMTPSGSTFTGVAEEFVTGTPLPLTDVVVNPADGAMYFAVGGRKTQSGLYRVTYTGDESTAPSTAKVAPTPAAADRRTLELLAEKPGPVAVDLAWPHLGGPDRFLRFAARNVLESRADHAWYARAFAETNPQAALTALLAVARTAAPDPLHKPDRAEPDDAVRYQVLGALAKIDFAKLPVELRLDYARVHQVALNRLGALPSDQRSALVGRLDKHFPTGNRAVDTELLNVLVFLQSPTAAAKGMKVLADAPTQEEQIDTVMALRMLTAGWTPGLRKAYFEWFTRAGTYKGGNSFQGFLKLIKADAVALLSDAEKLALKPVLDAKPATADAATVAPRPLVKQWAVADLAPEVEAKLKQGGRDYDKGRKLFGAASCFSCHRYDNEGGNTGPDLTGVAGRFNTKDLLESIILPNKEISDQYGAVVIETLDGKTVTGRIVNLNGDNVMVNTNGLNPNEMTTVNRNNIDTMTPSKVSMMPAGLLDTLTADEAADLAAYVLSRGDRKAAAFRK